jgi:hypothetical protein
MGIEEEWRGVVGFPDYEVSNLGRVKSHRRVRVHRKNKPKILTSFPNAQGYRYVTFGINGKRIIKYIHTMVLVAFSGPCPPGYEGNHDDGDKSNNCLSNLEWVTPSENVRHAYKTGLKRGVFGSKNHLSKLTECEVILLKRMINVGIKGIILSKLFNMSRAQISRIKNGKNRNYA